MKEELYRALSYQSVLILSI